MNAYRLLLGMMLAGVGAVGRAALPLEQRAAKPDEWGYRPADGAVVPLNPPTFTWIAPAGAATYTVQWSAERDFRNATEVEGVVWPTYTHHTPVPPGVYHWRYCFATAHGELSEWSI